MYIAYILLFCQRVFPGDKLELHLVKEELVFGIEFASSIRLEILVFLKFL